MSLITSSRSSVLPHRSFIVQPYLKFEQQSSFAVATASSVGVSVSDQKLLHFQGFGCVKGVYVHVRRSENLWQSSQQPSPVKTRATNGFVAQVVIQGHVVNVAGVSKHEVQKLRRVVTAFDISKILLEAVLKGDVAAGFIIENYGDYFGQVNSSGRICKQNSG